MIHQKRTSERRGEDTHTAAAPQVVGHRNHILKSRLWHLHFVPQPARLFFVFRAQDILEYRWCSVLAMRIATAVLEKGKLVCPYHISTLRTSNTPWFCKYRRRSQMSVIFLGLGMAVVGRLGAVQVCG